MLQGLEDKVTVIIQLNLKLFKAFYRWQMFLLGLSPSEKKPVRACCQFTFLLHTKLVKCFELKFPFLFWFQAKPAKLIKTPRIMAV